MDNEDQLENRRKKLIFRAGHRGTKEMDLLLGGFAAKHVPEFGEGQLDEFEALLALSDPDLYNYKSGTESPPSNLDYAVFKLFIDHEFTPER